MSGAEEAVGRVRPKRRPGLIRCAREHHGRAACSLGRVHGAAPGHSVLGMAAE